MSIGHNNPPRDESSIEETVSHICRLIEIVAVLAWLAYVALTAT